MHEPIKVAVFPCGSEVGLEINRSLRYARHFTLIGLNSMADHGRMVFDHYYGDLPSFKEPGFIAELTRIVRKEGIRFLIPAMDEVAAVLKRSEAELGCEVVCASTEVMEVLISKSATYQRLSGIVPVPKRYHGYEEILAHLPVFSKPDVGYGSRNVALIEREEQLKKRWAEREGLLFLEYLPGEEYTVDCFSDPEHKVLYTGPRTRRRIRMGISVNTLPASIDGVEEMAQKISGALKLQGTWFFQLKRNVDGALVLLEVASRLAGSMALNRLKGVNFVLLELFQRLGYPISIELNTLHPVELERAFDCKLLTTHLYDTVYVDFDDCLVIRGQLNTVLLRFLFQQVNAGKKIILITKHDGDLPQKLRALRIAELFDQIIHIKQGEDKYRHMKEGGAIFIDDSHIERLHAATNRHVIAVAPDIIDALIDYRKL
jgi:carbamoylphosphate synthase large subunit